MPDAEHIRKVARDLDRELGDASFVTLARLKATDRLRRASGEDGTRLKRKLAADLDHALRDRGVRTFPTFASTSTGDTVRLFRDAGPLAALLDLLEHPGPDTDDALRQHLNRVTVRRLDRVG